ncbi:MAG: FHA domain-containing protein [Planctomycetes bacterium]|nr:FHA domain-containing protein [Planctomycetota bacterium]
MNAVRATIEVIEGPRRGTRFELRPGQEVLVGRLPDCDVPLVEDPSISRRHFRLWFDGLLLRLINLSSNGTQVNGRYVSEVELADGDEIRIGANTILKVLLGAEPGRSGEGIKRGGAAAGSTTTEETGENWETARAARGEPSARTETKVRPTAAEEAGLGSESDAEATAAEGETAGAGADEDRARPGSPLGRLEVIHGPAAGATAVLQPGQSLFVGRATDCGLVIEGDLTVSRRHCRIHFLPPDCLLTNLSPNGTRINGREVQEEKLRDGDEIEIGTQTTLKIRLFHDRAVHADFTDLPKDRGGAPIPVVTCVERSGLLHMVCATAPASPAMLALQLSRGCSVVAVVDLNRAGLQLPDVRSSPQYLLDWMPPEAARVASPVIAAGADPELFSVLLDNAWRKDALAVFFSQNSVEELCGHLRSLANYNLLTGEQAAGSTLFVFWWPSLLRNLLECGDQRTRQRLLAGTEAVFFEDADTGGWQLFSRSEEFSGGVMGLDSLRFVSVT